MQLGFFTRAKPSCKSIITTQDALLRFIVFSFFRSNSFSMGVLRALNHVALHSEMNTGGEPVDVTVMVRDDGISDM